MKHPQLVALGVAVVAAVACIIGLGVTLDAPPWVPWGLGSLLSGFVAGRLAVRMLDERAIRDEAARFAPEPPQRPQGPQL